MAKGDKDGDGMYAWQAYIVGTDPTNAASVLKIQTLRRNSNGRLELTAATVTGRLC